jgi:serine phosphatase RsbU (regulator of sigma subunit)
VIARASHLLSETSEANRFAPVFYGVYDPATRLVTYANAGHNSPMLVCNGACFRRLKSLTPPAGMLAELPALQNSVELVSGDWLLIFSDGIPEATDGSGEDFGETGVLEAFGRHANGTAAEACEGVVNGVRLHFTEQRQSDDITFIAMKVL